MSIWKTENRKLLCTEFVICSTKEAWIKHFFENCLTAYLRYVCLLLVKIFVKTLGWETKRFRLFSKYNVSIINLSNNFYWFIIFSPWIIVSIKIKKKIFSCPSSTFRCEYGACISASARCDKKKDCLDGSDEFQKTCSPAENTFPVFFAVAVSGKPFGNASTPALPSTCTLPANSGNLQMKINCPKESPQCVNTTSRKVKWNTEVKYRCKEGYAAETGGNEFLSVCWKGSWLPNFTSCKSIYINLFFLSCFAADWLYEKLILIIFFIFRDL